jgi:hypothetical protein
VAQKTAAAKTAKEAGAIDLRLQNVAARMLLMTLDSRPKDAAGCEIPYRPYVLDYQ